MSEGTKPAGAPGAGAVSATSTEPKTKIKVDFKDPKTFPPGNFDKLLVSDGTQSGPKVLYSLKYYDEANHKLIYESKDGKTAIGIWDGKKQWVSGTPGVVRSDQKGGLMLGATAEFGYSTGVQTMFDNQGAQKGLDPSQFRNSGLQTTSMTATLLAHVGGRYNFNTTVSVEGTVGLGAEFGQRSIIGSTPSVGGTSNIPVVGAAGEGRVNFIINVSGERKVVSLAIGPAVRLGLLFPINEPNSKLTGITGQVGIPQPGDPQDPSEQTYNFGGKTFKVRSEVLNVRLWDILEAGPYFVYSMNSFDNVAPKAAGSIPSQGSGEAFEWGLSARFRWFAKPQLPTSAVAPTPAPSCSEDMAGSVTAAGGRIFAKQASLSAALEKSGATTVESRQAFATEQIGKLREEFVVAYRARLLSSKFGDLIEPGKKLDDSPKFKALSSSDQNYVLNHADLKQYPINTEESNLANRVIDPKLLTTKEQPKILGGSKEGEGVAVSFNSDRTIKALPKDCPTHLKEIYQAFADALDKVPEPKEKPRPSIRPNIIGQAIGALNVLRLDFMTLLPGTKAEFNNPKLYPQLLGNIQSESAAATSARVTKGLGGSGKNLSKAENFLAGKETIGRMDAALFQRDKYLLPYFTIGVYGYADRSDLTKKGKSGAVSPSNIALSKFRAQVMVNDLLKKGALPKLEAFGQDDAIVMSLRTDDTGTNFKQYASAAKGVVFDIIKFDEARLWKDYDAAKAKAAKKEKLNDQEAGLIKAVDANLEYADGTKPAAPAPAAPAPAAPVPKPAAPAKPPLRG